MSLFCTLLAFLFYGVGVVSFGSAFVLIGNWLCDFPGNGSAPVMGFGELLMTVLFFFLVTIVCGTVGKALLDYAL